MKTLLRIGATILAVALLSATPLYAAYDCGRHQASYFGLPYNPYALALAWADLPHTNAHPGAVVVQTRHGHNSGGGPGGHVSRIIQVTGHCRAIVNDEKGTYERDICSRLVAYVDPTSNGFTHATEAARHHRNNRLASREHRYRSGHKGSVHAAYAIAAYKPEVF